MCMCHKQNANIPTSTTNSDTTGIGSLFDTE